MVTGGGRFRGADPQNAPPRASNRPFLALNGGERAAGDAALRPPQVGNAERPLGSEIACLLGGPRHPVHQDDLRGGKSAPRKREGLEHLIEAAVEVVVLTAVFDLHSVKPGVDGIKADVGFACMRSNRALVSACIRSHTVVDLAEHRNHGHKQAYQQHVVANRFPVQSLPLVIGGWQKSPKRRFSWNAALQRAGVKNPAIRRFRGRHRLFLRGA